MSAVKADHMKLLLFIPLLLLSWQSEATRRVTLARDTTVTTAPGIGGTADIGFAFAKGDLVSIDARASKKLEQLQAYIFPDRVLGRSKYTKHARLTFTMPEDGIVIFRFISDRGGTNAVTYTVTRLPASDAVQNYNTAIEWVNPTDRIGTPVPKRVGEN
jgi:hypothetical protein